MLSLLLLKKIASLFIVLFIGVLIVRLKLVKAEDSKVLSVIVVYVLNPCVMILSLQRDRSVEVLKGLGFTTLVALGVMLLFLGLTALIRRPFRLTKVERGALEYPNVGNLIIPLVTSVLGAEYVVYTLGYCIIEHCFFWTHLTMRFSGEKRFPLKKLLLNPNIISIATGLVLFLTGIRLPSVALDAVSSLSDMIGPVAMLVTGMLIGGMDLKGVFASPRVWLISVLRLTVFPLTVLALFRFTGLTRVLPAAETMLFIVLISAAAPPANLVTSIAQLHGEDAPHASAITVVSVLLCILSMPAMVYLYQL